MKNRIIIGIIAILVIGILLGFLWSMRKPVENIPIAANPVESDSFGKYFSNFVIGRPGDNSKIGKDTLLVRATKFLPGERVGLRVQTASDITKAFTVEIRYLNASTGEETADLQKYRKRVTIQPGIRSYCCLTIPKTPGQINIGIVIGNYFLGTINGLTITPPRTSTGLL